MRTAVFGGSFNPIHLGHLVLADEILELLGLDRVLFVPAGTPPHKTPGAVAPARHRFAMVERAVAGHPGFAVSDVELRRPGASYTVDTLAALSAPDEVLHLIVGSEMFLDLTTWHEPRRIVDLARLVVVPRAGTPFDPDGTAAAAVLGAIGLDGFSRVPGPPASARTALLVDAMSLPISASDLRRRVRQGRSIAYRVPDAVGAYIAAHGLYRDREDDGGRDHGVAAIGGERTR